jgi:hypothetical protein
MRIKMNLKRITNLEDSNELINLHPDIIKCDNFEKFEKFAKEHDLNISEIKENKESKLIILVRINDKSKKINFNGFSAIQFVFKNNKLVDLNGKVKLNSSNKILNYKHKCVYVKRYLEDKDDLIDNLLFNSNLNKWFEFYLKDMDSSIDFKNDYLLDIVDNIEGLSNVQVDIKKIIPFKWIVSGFVTLNLNINEVDGVDKLAFNIILQNKEFEKDGRKISKINLLCKNNNWFFEKIELLNRGVFSTYKLEGDLLSVYHNVISKITLPINTLKGVSDISDGIVFYNFEDNFKLKMKEVILSNLFNDYGYNKIIDLRSDLSNQFVMIKRKNWSIKGNALLNYILNKNIFSLDESNLDILNEAQFNSLMEFNMLSDDFEAVVSNFETLEIFYSLLMENLIKVKKSQDFNSLNFNQFSDRLNEDIKKHLIK